MLLTIQELSSKMSIKIKTYNQCSLRGRENVENYGLKIINLFNQNGFGLIKYQLNQNKVM